MAPPPQDKSRKRSQRTKTSKTRKRQGPSTPTARKEKTAPVTHLPRLDGVGRLPSNAPTMAIAPSDYEHIFHEGPGAGGSTALERTIQEVPVSPQTPSPPPQPVIAAPSPAATTNSRRQKQYTLPTVDMDVYNTRTQTNGREGGGGPQHSPMPVNAYLNEVQVTPDGYNLLGERTVESSRRVALPAHIVRASNQFSRAALARVARYLASRSDYR